MQSTSEMLNRERKANKLAEVMKAAKFTAHHARLMDDENWRVAATVADVNMPSELTRRLVVEKLEEKG